MNTQQLSRMREQQGFIAALDQSGGSTPKALRAYGIPEDAYQNEAEMFDLVHEMRTRIIKSPSFSGEKILAAILFEQTMDREIDGLKTGDYLWQTKGIIPLIKVDQGLSEETDGVQLMKPIPELDSLLQRAVERGMFGTKMRSVIKSANVQGIHQLVRQQFELARRIWDAGLVPIIEPEVAIHSETKAEAEQLLLKEINDQMAQLPAEMAVIFKLTLPSQTNFYADLLKHPQVVRIVALSGGYSRAEANRLLAENKGIIASFSRALSEGLSSEQSDTDFDARLGESVDSIFQASIQ